MLKRHRIPQTLSSLALLLLVLWLPMQGHSQSTINVRFDTFMCTNIFPTVWRGQSFDTIGKFTRTFSAAGGGDSVVQYNIYPYKSYDYTIDSAVCDGTSVVWNGNTYTSNTTQVGNFTTTRGCDSIVHFVLTYHSPSSGLVSETIFQNQLPYTYMGRTFSAPGSALVVGKRVARPFCDSIVDYTLNVIYNVSTTVDSQICYSDLPLTWNSHTFSADLLIGNGQGVMEHTTTLVSHLGSDSILTMRLIVNPEYIQYDTMNVCPAQHEQPITWHHEILPAFTPSGDYTKDTVTVGKGCDSLFRLHLNLRNNTTATFTDSTIENDLPYNYLDWSFDHPVTDTVLHYTTTYLCDSAITFSLTIFYNVEAETYDTICYSAMPFRWNEKTFYAASLTDAEHRTGDIAQQAKLLTTHGADSMLTMHLHVYPTFDTVFLDTICADSTYTFNGNNYSFRLDADRAFRHDDTLRSINNCDSVSTIRLRVWPTYNIATHDTTYSDILPYTFGHYQCHEIGEYPEVTYSTHGCDSINTLYLWVIQVTHMDTSVCANRVPFRWHGQRFRSTTVDTVTLKGIHGEDSLLVLHTTILDTSETYDVQEQCDLFMWQNGITYTLSTDEPTVKKTNRLGCDSVIHLDLTLHYSVEIADHLIACNSYTWIDGVTYEETTYGPKKLLHTIYGCDSLVTLELYIAYSTYDEIIDSMCLGNRYNFRGRILSRAGTYVDSLFTVEHCDSITVLHLAELPSPIIEFTHRQNCDDNLYYVELYSDVDYIAWSSFPFDSALIGQEHNRELVLNPKSEVVYTIYADYLETPMCPATAQMTLSPLKRPTATMRISPEMLTYGEATIEAVDISPVYEGRNWYINGFMQENHGDKLIADCNFSRDSMIVMLEVVNGYCRDSARTVIPVVKPSIFVPAAFTPYLSTNNRFKPMGVGIVEYEMHIYNRKGQLVFETTDFEQSWDGKSHDKFCEQGVYVYTIRYRDVASPESYQELTGNLLLLR